SKRVLSDEFSRVRDATGLFNNIPDKKRPTFHEIRSLGARLLKDALMRGGKSEQEAKQIVNYLLGHTKIEQTDVYLKGGEVQWTDCESMLIVGYLLDRY